MFCYLKIPNIKGFELVCLCILVEKFFEFLVCLMGFLSRLAKTFPLLYLLSHFTPVKLFFEKNFTVTVPM